MKIIKIVESCFYCKDRRVKSTTNKLPMGVEKNNPRKNKFQNHNNRTPNYHRLIFHPPFLITWPSRKMKVYVLEGKLHQSIFVEIQNFLFSRDISIWVEKDFLHNAETE